MTAVDGALETRQDRKDVVVFESIYLKPETIMNDVIDDGRSCRCDVCDSSIVTDDIAAWFGDTLMLFNLAIMASVHE